MKKEREKENRQGSRGSSGREEEISSILFIKVNGQSPWVCCSGYAWQAWQAWHGITCRRCLSRMGYCRCSIWKGERDGERMLQTIKKRRGLCGEKGKAVQTVGLFCSSLTKGKQTRQLWSAHCKDNNRGRPVCSTPPSGQSSKSGCVPHLLRLFYSPIAWIL